MNNQNIIKEKKVEIPLSEYNLLREACEQLKRQALVLRILEAEQNLKERKVKKMDINKFIKSI